MSTRLPRTVLLGVLLLAGVAALAVVAPWIWGDAAAQTGGPLRGGPSGDHPLGTDAQGRDLLYRNLTATRLSLLMALGATAIAAVVGIGLGAAIASARGLGRWTGERLIDLLVAWPPILISLTFVTVFRPGAAAVVVAVGLAFAPQFARLSYTMASSIAQRDFVVTARLLGLRRRSIVWRHIAPNMASPLLVLVSSAFGTMIIALSALSMIGLGVQSPDYDWGTLLADGLRNMYANPAEPAGPAVGIVLTGFAAGLIGDGLAAFLNPARGVAAAPARPQPTTPVDPGPDVVAVVEDLRVSVHGDRHELVRGVSLHIREGEIVGLVGESGSGKSLTAMTLAQLTPPGLAWTASSASVAGHHISPERPPGPEFACDVGVVFQDPGATFNPARRLGPQLTEVLRVHGGDSRRASYAKAERMLGEVRIDDPARRLRQYPHELSGGMRQRAMIASALLTEPRLIIADEPTTALDVTVQASVLRTIRDVNQRHGTAVLLISHDIAIVAAMCDRVYVMYDGSIVEELTGDALRRGAATHDYTRKLLNSSLQRRPTPGTSGKVGIG